MSKRFSKFAFAVSSQPLLIAEAMLAVSLLVVGIYTLSPWYVVTPTTALAQVFEQSSSRMIVGGLYATTALLTLIGLRFRKKSLRSSGAFMGFLSFAFQLCIRFLTIGFVPWTWVYLAALGFLYALVYFSVRGEIHAWK